MVATLPILPFAQVRFAASCPKAGGAASENEDRWDCGVSDNGRTLVVAVSDGASDGYFAERWAALLTRAFCEHPLQADFISAVPDLRLQWRADANAELLPWYAQARLQRGAAATLLGLRIASDLCWKAAALGDTNLFHLRGEELLTAFPLSRADDFAGFPVLLKTSDDIPPLHSASGVGEPGDDLFIATDALASWCVAEAEREGGAPWAWLRSLSDPARFDNFVQEQRGLRRLQNDDTTLIHVRLGGGE